MTDSLSMTGISVRRLGAQRPWYARPARLAAATLSAVGQALFAVPAALLAVLTLLSVVLGVFGLGVVLALIVVPSTQQLANWQRRIASHQLGRPVQGEYGVHDGTNHFALPLRWLREARRWQDVLWLVEAGTVGIVLSLLPLAMAAAWIVFLVLGCVFGLLWWLLLAFVGLPALVLWWFFAPELLRVKAGVDSLLLGTSREAELAERVEAVTESRTAAVDMSSAEIRRIERDLHDGAQARIAALGMTIGLAEQQLSSDPEAVAQLLREARDTATSALTDLRAVVRGMHPPVLADRGLAGAIDALLAPIPLPVDLAWDVLDTLPPPARSAVYFAVAECLTNAVKHSGASRLRVSGAHRDGRLQVVVGDNGRGGADRAGSGLSGVARRLDAFDGTMDVSSPAGGPTTITMEMRC